MDKNAQANKESDEMWKQATQVKRAADKMDKSSSFNMYIMSGLGYMQSARRLEVSCTTS